MTRRAGVFFVFAASFGAAVARSMLVHERRSAFPSGFVRTGAAAADEVLELRFALKSKDMSGLETAIMDAATPGSPNFRQWLSKEQVRVPNRAYPIRSLTEH